MKRRDVITLLGAMVSVWTCTGTFAAKTSRTARIGELWVLPPPLEYENVLREPLAALGWREGENLQIEQRVAGNLANLPRFATELVALQPDVLIVPGSTADLARAYGDLQQFGNAARCLSEGMALIETTGERWCEAEVNRVAGEFALKPPEHDISKAQSYFERALTVARQQLAKSWELRAAMSMARLCAIAAYQRDELTPPHRFPCAEM